MDGLYCVFLRPQETRRKPKCTSVAARTEHGAGPSSTRAQKSYKLEWMIYLQRICYQARRAQRGVNLQNYQISFHLVENERLLLVVFRLGAKYFGSGQSTGFLTTMCGTIHRGPILFCGEETDTYLLAHLFDNLSSSFYLPAYQHDVCVYKCASTSKDRKMRPDTLHDSTGTW